MQIVENELNDNNKFGLFYTRKEAKTEYLVQKVQDDQKEIKQLPEIVPRRF